MYKDHTQPRDLCGIYGHCPAAVVEKSPDVWHDASSAAVDNKENEQREAERKRLWKQAISAQNSSLRNAMERILTQLRLIDVLCLAFLLLIMFFFKIFRGLLDEIIKHTCMVYYIFLFVFHTTLEYTKKIFSK